MVFISTLIGIVGIYASFIEEEKLKSLDPLDVFEFALSHDLRSIEEVLERTDSTTLEKWLLLYGSLTDDPRPMKGDAENPRVPIIQKTSDGFHIMMFNGSSTLNRFHSLEFLSFDGKAMKYKLSELRFSKEEGKPKLIEHPSDCIACHGSDELPIWSTYNLWPGVAGEARFFGNRGLDAEKKLLADFWAQKDSHPRYKYLTNHPYRSRESLWEEPLAPYCYNFEDCLTHSAERFLAKRFADDLNSTSPLWKYRYIVMVLALESGASGGKLCLHREHPLNFFIPKDYTGPLSPEEKLKLIKDDTEERSWKYYDLRRKRMIDQLKLPEELDQPRRTMGDYAGPAVSYIPEWRWLLESNGVSMAEWSPSFPRDSYVFRTPTLNSFQLFPVFLAEYLESKIENENWDEPKDRELFMAYKKEKMKYLNAGFTAPRDYRICEKLYKASHIALSQ